MRLQQRPPCRCASVNLGFLRTLCPVLLAMLSSLRHQLGLQDCLQMRAIIIDKCKCITSYDMTSKLGLIIKL